MLRKEEEKEASLFLVVANDEGLKESLREPEALLPIHVDKVQK